MTDFKDNFGPSFEDKDKDSVQAGVESTSPFGTLKRTNTNPLSAGINGSSSPWSGPPPSAGVSPMGAFGSFAIGGASTQIPISGDKPGFGSLRGQSRFKGLMNAGNSENTGSKVKEKASVNSLEKLAESTIEPTQSQWGNDRNMLPRSMNHTLYGDEEDFSTGSAALGGDDASPPLPQSTRYKKPDRQTSYDEIGFSSIGVSSDIPPFRELMQRRDYAQQQTPQHRTLGVEQMNEPMSPTNTNPYQSPEGEKSVPDDIDTDDSDLHSMQYPGAGPFGHGARGFQNQLDAQSNDRSQTSSTGASRGFSSLGGLGSIAALGGSGNWSAAPGAIGTPSRVQPSISAGYSDFAFGSRGDLNSPTHGGLGSPGIFGAGTPSAAGNAGPIGRNSKFNSLLPNVTQEQMRGDTSRQEQPFEENSDSIQNQNAPGFSMRDLEGSSRLGRGVMDEIHGKVENRNRGMQGLSSPFSTNETGQISSSQPAASQALFPGGSSASNYFARAQDQDNVASQMPASQQRQMVMPDRMRWIYRDPQGNTQGPWSGLEMHDWYKAGFFSPELQVKKLEDGDYEPLAQLIRRIGNSREPFLVPQIGIPHGSSSALPSSTTASAGAVPATTPSAAQPPFASSFPSFGTTLSAEQQNALERRKQEEQYLMARQKEHLAQQQVMLKQMQHMQGGVHGQQLHHHSSAHSLQSQPSFGSITSPVGYQPSAGQVPIQPPASGPGFFDGLSRNAGVLGAGADPLSSVREEDFPGLMERLELGRGAQPPFNSSHYTQEGQGHPQHVAAILQERARQHREQEQYDLLQRNNNDDQRTTAERLEQYHQLRAQEEQSQYQQPGPVGGHVHSQSSGFDLPGRQRHDIGHEYDQSIPDPQEQLSLSEQVQKAAAKQAPTTQQQSPWAKMDSGMPQPFPPPQSSSPMPAPTPQRNRQSVADALNVESQSQSPSQADSIETPSAALAPWAKESAEGAKGPSLKEIQAMEARQAAQQEEIAAAARRVAVEQERLNQQNHQTIGPAPGLPSSANWASSISPAVPANTGASAWAKPAAGKPAVATPVSGAKKTLTQIQKEEEARKSRAAAAAAANAASNASSAAALAGGKRYADLAGKASVPTPTSSAAWTTVGAGGKVKTPTVPAPSVNTRTASGGIVQPSAPVVVAKSKAGTSVGTRGPGNPQQANEEFQKWVKSALSKYLNSNMSGRLLEHSCPSIGC